jgi:hypothetical protein
MAALYVLVKSAWVFVCMVKECKEHRLLHGLSSQNGRMIGRRVDQRKAQCNHGPHDQDGLPKGGTAGQGLLSGKSQVALDRLGPLSSR